MQNGNWYDDIRKVTVYEDKIKLDISCGTLWILDSRMVNDIKGWVVEARRNHDNICECISFYLWVEDYKERRKQNENV